MTVKTTKFLKNFQTLSEDKALEVLASLTEKEIEELCEGADKLDSESKQKLIEMLDSIPDEESEELNEDDIETAAGQTIVSKTGMIANAVGAMTMMPINDLSHFLDQALAASQQYSSQIPDDAAAKNMASVAMKGAVKEDLEQNIFSGSDLSEETKFKIATIFEAAVNSRVALIAAQLEESYDEAIEENLAFVTETLEEKTDQYLSYVAEKWLEENELQVETGLREEITSDFMSKLKDLFIESYIDVPESENNAVELLAQKVANLEDELNESIRENIELRGVLNETTKEDIVEELAVGLTISQANSLRSLSESVDFDGDVDEFVNKLTVLKESNFSKTYTPSNILTEEYEAEEEVPQKKLSPDMAAYVATISRSKIK
jgi:hypothetical protein